MTEPPMPADPTDALPTSEAVDLDRLTLRDALDWFGAAHLPDAPFGEIERCRTVLLGVVAAQRAAEAARVREEAFPTPTYQEREAGWTVSFAWLKRICDFVRARDFTSISEEQAQEVLEAIRALREAPRG